MPFYGGVYPPFPSVCPPIYLLVLLSASGLCPSVRIDSQVLVRIQHLLVLFLVRFGDVFDETKAVFVLD